MDECDAAFVEQLAIGAVGIDDDEMLLVVVEMALDQRQRSLADRAEADHHDRAVDAPVPWPMRHGSKLLLWGMFGEAGVWRGASGGIRRA